MSNYGSRKFILAALTLASSSYLTWAGVIDAATYQAVVLGTVGVYVAGNVGQKAWVKE